MKKMVFIPVYDNGWQVVQESLDDLRMLYRTSYGEEHYCKYKKGAGFYGAIYDAGSIYDTEEAAFAYIQKDYGRALADQHVFSDSAA